MITTTVAATATITTSRRVGGWLWYAGKLYYYAPKDSSSTGAWSHVVRGPACRCGWCMNTPGWACDLAHTWVWWGPARAPLTLSVCHPAASAPAGYKRNSCVWIKYSELGVNTAFKVIAYLCLEEKRTFNSIWCNNRYANRTERLGELCVYPLCSKHTYLYARRTGTEDRLLGIKRSRTRPRPKTLLRLTSTCVLGLHRYIYAWR